MCKARSNNLLKGFLTGDITRRPFVFDIARTNSVRVVFCCFNPRYWRSTMMTSICPDKAKEPDATEHRVLLTIAAALLLIFRRPESILNPQFWAEDATVFFAGAHQYGLASVWQTHAGYFVLLPRIIAFLALKVPLLHVPFFYNVAAASLILVVFY